MHTQRPHLHPLPQQTAISTSTSFDCKVVEAGDGYFAMHSTASFEFDPSLETTKFVVFTATDATVRDAINANSASPLWESFYEFDATKMEEFQEFVNNLLTTVEVRFSYVDGNGEQTIDWYPAKFDEVSVANWSSYMDVFGHQIDVPLHESAQLFDRVRIFECDLKAAAPTLERVESFAWRCRTVHSYVHGGMVSWQAPIPCRVDTINFDVTGIARPGRRFQIVPHLGKGFQMSGWLPAEEIQPFEVNAWAMPGQGVTVLWTDE